MLWTSKRGILSTFNSASALVLRQTALPLLINHAAPAARHSQPVSAMLQPTESIHVANNLTAMPLRSIASISRITNAAKEASFVLMFIAASKLVSPMTYAAPLRANTSAATASTATTTRTTSAAVAATNSTLQSALMASPP